ncbi:MAG: 3-isopropylmalate dehydratase large subunit, partial [Actinobacteria bacterium]|nr:3-isopropylmalate dehydratase large subunit [Actinomycetota bacterium]MCG2807774.1 3-isopropylmalate dehydratase large subunit [Coriobacteriia bacterium]
PGQLINCALDIVLANDVTAPISIKEFRKIGVAKVFDPEKIALVPDHYTPNKDIKSAEQAKMVREFAREQGVTHYYEIGCMGVEHALLPEQGVVGAGDVIIGADSHTCTYGALGAFATGVGSTDAAVGMATGEAWFKVPASIKFNVTGKLVPWVCGKDIILHIIGMIGVDGALYQSMEFVGDTIDALGMDDRMTICNMAIEAGGKSGIIAVDDTTRAYMDGRTERPWVEYFSDPDAEYVAVYDIDASTIKPTVAFPHLPSNTRNAEDSRDIWVDQVVIGSCTNGRIEDMRIAASVLKGRKVHENIRLIIIPATQQIYREAMHEGLFDIFLDAGAAVSTPTCGPCLGGHMGILAAGERALATTNRNFVGRMGDPTSEVYLASPAVAAATAIAGHIALPDDLG